MGATAVQEAPGQIPASQYFQQEKKAHTDAANEIIAEARAAGRPMTDEEKGKVKDHIAAAEDFKKKIVADRENAKLAAEVARLGADLATEPAEEVPGGKHRSMAEAFVKSDAMKALRARGLSGRFQSQPVLVPRFAAANEGIVFQGQGDNADMILPSRIPGIQRPVEAPLVIADLFNTATTEGNTKLLAKETVTTNAADITAELATKPRSDIQFDTVQVTLEKIATTIKVSTEMLEDEDGMLEYLQNRLEFFVQAKEEVELIEDLLAQAGQTADPSDVEGDNLFDAILAGAVKCRTEGGLDADAVVLTSLDWAKLSVMKSPTTDAYYSGGPYGAAGDRLWGRFRFALSERIGDGNVVVGAFEQGGTIWRKREGVTIDATNSNEDDFLKNLTAIRAEERMILFLERPDAFCVVSAEAS